jgi:hypothetical protein
VSDTDQALRLRRAHAVQPEDRLIVRTATGDWVHAIADSWLEGVYGLDESKVYRKIHDFPVVWIRFPRLPGSRTPWPAEDVQRLCRCDGYVYIGPDDPYCDGCSHLDEEHIDLGCEAELEDEEAVRHG